MKKSNWCYVFVFILLIFVLAACSESGTEQVDSGNTGTVDENQNNGNGGEEAELPDVVSIVTHAQGGGYHTVGSGLASVISDNTPIRAIVQPTAGPNAWMSDMAAGRVDFGLIAGPDAAWAQSGGPGFDNATENLRVLFGGPLLSNSGLAVREDSGIDSLADLKGKRVGSDYGGNVFSDLIAEALLASAGLTWDDVKEVPVPDTNTALTSLQNGAVDAVIAASYTSPNTMEVHQAVGLKILPFADLKPEDIQDGLPDDLQAIMDDLLPGVFLHPAPGGEGILTEDTLLPSYEMFMVATEDTSPETVYTVLKAIWENSEKMHDIHPWTANLSPDNMATTKPPIPYHEGAVKFYKEIGVWTDEHESN
ncbi:TAXI family TRAP transporter solute-binding subunit [Robertmurraya massiliosenegalensis]|uniref:TAXI family TRAP transporter solute-binding subunit n=1 Tax=Robertmurraya TaxID=2837507 RepID=UPI0039A53299